MIRPVTRHTYGVILRLISLAHNSPQRFISTPGDIAVFGGSDTAKGAGPTLATPGGAGLRQGSSGQYTNTPRTCTHTNAYTHAHTRAYTR